MEETKLKESDLNPQIIPYQDIQWFWQSDPNPWKEKDRNKWIWQPYTSHHSIIIEEAFSLAQGIADIGDYEIDLKKMLQVHKKDKNKLRRVKREYNRESQNRFLIELPRPSIIEKEQKTINAAFGTVQHFLNYIMKRTPESLKLFYALEKISLSSKRDEFEDIVQEVIRCIQKVVECREKVIKTRTGNAQSAKTFIQEANQVVNEIQSRCKSSDLTLKDFLKVILRVYTMESFVCYWLNELLRSENWEEINVLTPYLVCLTYAFQVKDYIIKQQQQPKHIARSFLSLFTSQKILLYRGTALMKEHLHYYNTGNTRFFSWNGVTSTSRNKEQALKFIKLSLKKIKTQDTHASVLFIIQADLASEKDCEGMIDVSQDSRYPHEEEVILAPGTVFEVMSAQLNKTTSIYEVKLIIRKQFTKDHKLLGDFQARIIAGNTAQLKDLLYDDIIKALVLLESNQVVTKLEIEGCSLNCHLMQMIEHMGSTTNIKKENITLRKNYITVDSLSTLCHYYTSMNMNSIIQNNEIKFAYDGLNNALKGQDWRIKSLKLEEETLEFFLTKITIPELSKMIYNETQLADLNLQLKNQNISENSLISVLTPMKTLIGLKKITLAFEYDRFGFRPGPVTDRVLEMLADCIVNCLHVQDIDLHSRNCKLIKKKGIDSLTSAFQQKKALSRLAIGFNGCYQLNSATIGKMHCKILESCNVIQHLCLKNDYDYFTEDEILKLAKSLRFIPSLQSLSLKAKPSSYGLICLATSLKFVPSLQELALDLKDGVFITYGLILDLVNNLKLLVALERFSYIIDTSYVKGLLSPIAELTRLKKLSLVFRSCGSDVELDEFTNILGSLRLLSYLHLESESDYSFISDQGVERLSVALRGLNALQYLSLVFPGFRDVTDQGIKHLKNAIQSLTLLEQLTIKFFGCRQISDNGIAYMRDALKPLINLKELSVNFNGVNRISDKGIKCLEESLKLLTKIEKLTLILGDNITEKGRKNLEETVKMLPVLRNYKLSE